MIQVEGNLSKEDAYRAIYLVDSKGLVTTTRGDKLAEHKVPFARTDGSPDMKNLREIIDYAKPHALFGLSGSGPSFTEPMVKALCSHCTRPLIFPLSNPTSKAEITAENAVNWSEGKAIFAAGSPFPPVEYGGRTIVPGQANNVFIFPGVGFGAVQVKASKVSDEMLVTASKALASSVSDDDLDQGRIYPEIKDLRRICVKIAAEVGATALRQGLARMEKKPLSMPAHMITKMWTPQNEA